jgi:hypothetical protein
MAMVTTAAMSTGIDLHHLKSRDALGDVRR